MRAAVVGGKRLRAVDEVELLVGLVAALAAATAAVEGGAGEEREDGERRCTAGGEDGCDAGALFADRKKNMVERGGEGAHRRRQRQSQ